MKIAVSATGPGLDAQVDPRFGRCQYFVVIDPDNMEFESIENSSARASGGAGISVAQTIAGKGVLQTTLTPQPALAFLPYHLTYLSTQGEGQYNYTVLVANHGLRTIRCRITLEGAPQVTYHVQTRELSDASLTQYNDWTPPTTEETGDIIVQFPPQSVIWIKINTSGPYIILTRPSTVQVQLFAIAADVADLKLQIVVRQGYAICSA